MENEYVRVRMPKGKQVIGIVETMLGAGKFRVKCTDLKIRICRIPGKFRRRMWVRQSDVVLVEPWEIQGDERGDIVWKYTKTQAEWLRKRGMIEI
ncbi:MAG: translation initiation factor eIF-1A [Candidatus Aenigmarchaeota archaeon]|nr:translation initiation factor eIF-1A [Candidatus Aenigmarchaeota archaeon]OYT58199.1 MAG: translation initiation factor eIF-1A [Candidatus Aenigmarchaeota archaeon ex4484_14]RLI97387.1 MAG: translation initiation factor eIF-1A [Candidatus Aenigmarchaeota archaeon]RLJ04310.1 MAG: translation initiation factor eIF-1A [Candidatus Aenigmarchaeota archaeon]